MHQVRKGDPRQPRKKGNVKGVLDRGRAGFRRGSSARLFFRGSHVAMAVYVSFLLSAASAYRGEPRQDSSLWTLREASPDRPARAGVPRAAGGGLTETGLCGVR